MTKEEYRTILGWLAEGKIVERYCEVGEEMVDHWHQYKPDENKEVVLRKDDNFKHWRKRCYVSVYGTEIETGKPVYYVVEPTEDEEVPKNIVMIGSRKECEEYIVETSVVATTNMSWYDLRIEPEEHRKIILYRNDETELVIRIGNKYYYANSYDYNESNYAFKSEQFLGMKDLCWAYFDPKELRIA